MPAKVEREMSFMDHLEELRWHLVRSVVAVLAVTILVFVNKLIVFEGIVLAPKHLDFITYKAMCWLGLKASMGDVACLKEIPFTITNIEMAGQFLLHIKVSVVLGLILAFPYVLFEVWRFVKPALYAKERFYSQGIVFFSSLLFYIGIGFGYFVIAPFSINFLGSYTVSPEVSNTINLGSYISTVIMLVLLCGLIFELPIVVFLLSKLGLLTPKFMRQNRRYAIVIILIISAVLTPPDITSQVLIAFPLYFLYEMSIFISATVSKKQEE